MIDLSGYTLWRSRGSVHNRAPPTPDTALERGSRVRLIGLARLDGKFGLTSRADAPTDTST